MKTWQTERMIDPATLHWPVTYRWTLSTPFGLTQQELTVDVRELQGDNNATRALGKELWARAIAMAMHRSVVLRNWETVIWSEGNIPSNDPDFMTAGMLHGTPTDRNNSGCLVLMTGHDDPNGMRQLCQPCLPSTWVNQGVLSRGGREAMETWAQFLFMGLAGHLTASPMVWLIAYPRALTGVTGVLSEVGFRRVEYVRVCRLTTRAPDRSVAVWP